MASDEHIAGSRRPELSSGRPAWARALRCLAARRGVHNGARSQVLLGSLFTKLMPSAGVTRCCFLVSSGCAPAGSSRSAVLSTLGHRVFRWRCASGSACGHSRCARTQESRRRLDSVRDPRALQVGIRAGTVLRSVGAAAPRQFHKCTCALRHSRLD